MGKRSRSSSRNQTRLRNAIWKGMPTSVTFTYTTYSFDAFAFGTLATPYYAYRYAKGEAIKHPGGFDMQLDRPLDFYAVSEQPREDEQRGAVWREVGLGSYILSSLGVQRIHLLASRELSFPGIASIGLIIETIIKEA